MASEFFTMRIFFERTICEAYLTTNIVWNISLRVSYIYNTYNDMRSWNTLNNGYFMAGWVSRAIM